MNVRCVLLLVPVVLVAGCDDAAKSDAPGEACAQLGFSTTAATWALPADVPGSSPLAWSETAAPDCETDPAAPAHAIVDLTGDGRLDLVIAHTCDGAVPTDAWWVYPGMDGGFSPDRTTWSLPRGYGGGAAPFPFPGTTLVDDCADGGVDYLLRDLTADGLPDLVVAADCADPELGDLVWKVHAGVADGFAATATDWALPPTYGTAGYAPFDPSHADGYCGRDAPAWSLLDMDTDGRPDLVVTEHSTDCEFADVGDEAWLVHHASPNGFDTPPTSWSLPTAYGEPGVGRFYDTAFDSRLFCEHNDTNVAYFTAHADADGFLDLFVTGLCTRLDLGDTRWLLHRGGSDGFADTPSDWALPAAHGAEDEAPFQDASGLWTCADGANQYGYDLADWSGDGALDLLVFGACDAEGWTLHAGGHDGFDLGRDWPVPDWRSAGFGSLWNISDDTSDCDRTDTDAAWNVLDLDGDGRRDLVVYDSCSDDAIGRDHWVYYPGTCER